MPKVQVQGRTLKITIILLFITLLGTALRFHRLGADSLWADEIVGTMHAQNEALSIPASLREGGAHPPLWHLLTHFVLYLGKSEFILRFPAAFMGILSISLMYIVGQRLFTREVGVFGSFLLALSPSHLQYSQEARMYAAIVPFSLFSLYLLWRALERSEKGLWIGFVLFTILNIYNTYFAFFVLVSEAVFALVVVVAKSWPGKVKGVKKPIRSWFLAFLSLPQVRGLFLSLIIVGLLYLPWLPTARANLLVRQSEKEGAWAGPKEMMSLSLVLGLAGDFSPQEEGSLFLAFIGAFMVGGFLLAFRRRWRELLLVFLWMALPLVAVAAMGGVRKYPSRYVIHILPLYLMIVSLGFEGLVNLSGVIGTKVGHKDLSRVLVSFLLILAVGQGSVYPLQSYYLLTKQNWRDIAAFLRERARSDEVIAVRHWLPEGLLYYSPDLANIYSVEDSLPELERTIAPYNGIWFLRSSGKTADPEGKIKRWLAENEFVRIIGGRSGGGLSLYYGKNGGPMTVEETIALLGGATKFFPEPRLHCDLGQAYEAIGELEKAEMEYGKGLELDPTNRCFLQELGGTYLASGRAQEVVEEYKRAVALDPELDEQAWFHLCLGRAYKQSGCREEAIREYERVLELKPGNPAARRALEALDR